MSTLYIFGNGFDLAHGIQTTYSSFRSFLNREHEEFLTRFESMYHIQPLDDTEPWYSEESQKKWDKHVLSDLWKCFEDEIGHPDVEGMYGAAQSLVDELPEEGIKDTLDYYWRKKYGFSAELQKYVLEWLTTVDTSIAHCKKTALIKANTDVFITFNYTDTLERVYGIDNVLHIHGGVPSCSNVLPIMGHGNQHLINSYRDKANSAASRDIEWECSIDSAIADYCKSIYKDTDAILARNEAFFSGLGDIDEVVCLGLSFGDVDIPYLERILRGIKSTTKWMVYYYGDESHQRLESVFGILGIRRRFETYLLPSDRFWD